MAILTRYSCPVSVVNCATLVPVYDIIHVIQYIALENFYSIINSICRFLGITAECVILHTA